MAAVETLITDHLDLWTAALKRKSTAGRGSSSKVELYGIKKLRELILELAVRGLLVPQDPSDEPASELLKRIAADKAKLVKAGKIKKEKPLTAVAEEESPFRVPNTWAWERLGKVCQKLTDGSHNPPADAGTGYAMLSSQNINYNKIDFQNPSRFVSEDDFQKENQRTLIEPNDVLLNIVASIGRAAVVPADAPKFVLQRSVAVLKSGLAPQFLAKQLVAPSCLHYYEVHAKGTAQKGIYLGQLSLMPMVVPPLAEQHRIVAKVDELMALCDQLEQQTDASLGAHQTLVETLLSALTSAADYAQFASAWQRIAGHFDTLFTTEESIAQLKQTILQLAVMGKLVPQDPNDEPASELLKKIAARPHKHTLPGWATVSLGQLGDILGGATPSKSNAEYWAGNIPWVSPKDMKRNLITDAEDHVSEAAISNSSLKKIPPGSLLMVVRGMILAHSFPVAISECEVTINQDMKALVIPPELGAYLLTFMQAMKGAFVALVDRSSHGTCKLVSEKLWSYPVSLPPLAEQHRIVAKVDALMALCEQLKSRLSDAQTTQLHLADALVEQAIC